MVTEESSHVPLKNMTLLKIVVSLAEKRAEQLLGVFLTFDHTAARV